MERPLWVSYEQDLSRLLIDLDPEERAEVLAGVREHVNASMAERPNAGSADLQAVLAELGPAEVVAQEAYAGHRPLDSSARHAPAPALARSWVLVVVALLQALGLFLVVVAVMGSFSYATMEGPNATGGVTRSVENTSGMLPMVVGLVVMLPMWIPVVVLTGISALWDRRQKTTHILLLPAVALLVALIPNLGWLLAEEVGLNAGAWAAIAASTLGGGWALWWLTARGVAQTHAFTALPSSLRR
ncbi:MAG: hypothetical protein WA991_17095 [Ornithinimicrobium sp.]